jgi:hypothetical protein
VEASSLLGVDSVKLMAIVAWDVMGGVVGSARGGLNWFEFKWGCYLHFIKQPRQIHTRARIHTHIHIYLHLYLHLHVTVQYEKWARGRTCDTGPLLMVWFATSQWAYNDLDPWRTQIFIPNLVCVG